MYHFQIPLTPEQVEQLKAQQAAMAAAQQQRVPTLAVQVAFQFLAYAHDVEVGDSRLNPEISAHGGRELNTQEGLTHNAALKVIRDFMEAV